MADSRSGSRVRAAPAATPGPAAIVACPACGLAHRIAALDAAMAYECGRCGALLRRPKSDSLQRTAAFSLAALALYVPANIYPILRMTHYGLYSENTVWSGCVALFHDRQWLVAGIVFLASIAIPFCKLLGLFFLVATVNMRSAHWRRERTWVHRIISVIGPWAMLDVFLLAILVSLVKLRQVATVLPGPGLLAFAAVVVLTILASASFDPELIWRDAEPTP